MATPNIVPRADSEGQLGTSSKYWAAAYIDAVYVGAGFVGRDADNNIDFSVDDRIQFEIAGSVRTKMTSSTFFPATNDQISLGVAGTAFSDLFLASGAVINFADGDIALTHGSNVLEFTGGLMRFVDSQKLTFGSSNDLEIYHDTSNSYIVAKGTGDLIIQQTTDDKDIIFQSDDGSGGVETYFFLDGSLDTNFPATVFPDASRLYFGDGLDFNINHNGISTFLSNNVGDVFITNNADDKDIIFKCDDGSGGTTEYLRLDGSSVQTIVTKNFRYIDNAKAIFGTGEDLQIYHDGSSSYIENGDGNMFIMQRANDADLVFQADNGAGADATYFYLDGSSATHDGSATTALYTNWPDNSRISLGTGHDLRILHNGSASFLDNLTGDLYFRNFANDEDIIFQSDDGSGGVETYFFLDGSGNTGNIPRTVFPDNSNLVFGTGNDLFIRHNSANSEINNFTGDLTFQQAADDKDIIFKCDDGSGGTTAYLTLDGSAGHTRIYKNTVYEDSVQARFGNGEDFKITHDGSNSSLTNETGDFYIKQRADDKDIIFQSDDGSGGTTTYFALDGEDGGTRFYRSLTVQDNVGLAVGSGLDFSIEHNGSNTTIAESTGDLTIKNTADDGDIIFQSDDGSGGVATYLALDGGAALTKFYKDVKHLDSVKSTFGDSADLQILHDGSNSYIHHNTTGNLNIKADVGNINITNFTNDADIVLSSDDSSGGTTAYITLDGSAARTVFSRETLHSDNVKGKFGSNGDLQIFHDGSHSYIIENGTGNLWIGSNGGAIYLGDEGANEIYLQANDNGAVNLYYDNSTKLATTATGIDITGAVTFSSVDTFGQLVVKAASGSTGDMLNIGVDTANSVAFIQAVERGTNTIPLSLQRYGGNVGIGTDSPGTINSVAFANVGLHVKNGALGRTITEGSGSAAFVMNDSGATSNQRVKYIKCDNGVLSLGKIADNGTETTNLSILDNGNVGIGIAAPASLFHIYENNTATGGEVGLTIEQDGTGDAVVQYLLSGTKRWVTGIDNSDSNNFKIASSADLGTDNVLTLSTDGSATFAGTITSTSATGNAAGAGFNTSGTVAINVGEINGEIITTIKVDLGTGAILSSSTAGDVIGEDDTEGAFLTRITTAVNGIVYRGEMICVEVPTTGDPDINLAANSSATLAEDGAGEGEHVLINGGTATLAKHYPSFTIPSGGIQNDHLYLTHGGTTAGTYGAGQFIIKLYGAAVVS